MAVLGKSGATNPPLIPDVLLTVSTTWSPPYKVKALVRCFGGGGSGAVGCIDSGYSGYSVGVLSGGGAGEHAGSILELDPSVTYTVVVGAGGVKKNRSSDGVATGNAGGNTSFAGSGVTTITANGGAGGPVGATGSGGGSSVVSVTGAAGGSGGAGELYRYTGGAAGSAIKASGSSAYNVVIATGGGAVGLFGTGFAGGAGGINSGGNNELQASGGGGVNGAGGATSDSTDVTWGGSTFGPGSAYASGPPGFAFPNNWAEVYPNTDSWEATIDFWNGGSLLERVNHTFQPSSLSNCPPGTGGMGKNTSSWVQSYGSGATLFAGGGANAKSVAFEDSPYFMSGGRLGGGGGAGGGGSHSGSRVTYSGMGGHGGVLIEMLERIV